MPTAQTLNLFAYRLYECDRTCDVNIKTSRTPLFIRTNEKLKHTFTQIWNKYNGNEPVIVTDKNGLNLDDITVFRTDTPLIVNDITEYKQKIWNEALSFLGINNISVEKKERLITDETNANNELINLNLQSYLIPRQKACEQFNKFYNLTGNNAISVRVRSDLNNIIKQQMSTINDFKNIYDEIEVE